jgi:hypothetical protein
MIFMCNVCGRNFAPQNKKDRTCSPPCKAVLEHVHKEGKRDLSAFSEEELELYHAFKKKVAGKETAIDKITGTDAKIEDPKVSPDKLPG